MQRSCKPVCAAPGWSVHTSCAFSHWISRVQEKSPCSSPVPSSAASSFRGQRSPQRSPLTPHYALVGGTSRLTQPEEGDVLWRTHPIYSFTNKLHAFVLSNNSCLFSNLHIMFSSHEEVTRGKCGYKIGTKCLTYRHIYVEICQPFRTTKGRQANSFCGCFWWKRLLMGYIYIILDM